MRPPNAIQAGKAAPVIGGSHGPSVPRWVVAPPGSDDAQWLTGQQVDSPGGMFL